MSNTLKLALLQHLPTPAAADTALQRLDEFAARAADADCDLLLLPEAGMSGYNISVAERDRVAETADGELCSAVADLCRKHQIAVSFGFIERSKAQYYNSVRLIDKTGEAITHYRKTHLWGDLDHKLFSAGESLSPIVELEGWKIGHLICYDVEFPETVRCLALQGADLVLISTALMSPWTTVADLIVPARAFENQIYIAYANYSGEENGIEYVGHSCITGPEGNALAKAGTEAAMLTATLDQQLIRRARERLPYHRDRRPELYGRLVQAG